MWERFRLKKVNEHVFSRFGNLISNHSDLVGDGKPSFLFHILGSKFRYLIAHDIETVISAAGIRRRRRFNFLIKTFGRFFLTNKQIFLTREELIGDTREIDDEFVTELTEKPVIYVANHFFKDDVLGSILATRGHTYVFFGSLPFLFNTFGGIIVWLNGGIFINRKVKKSKEMSSEKAIYLLNEGTDLLLYPEGVWNKTSELLMLPLWAGVYRIAKKTGAKIVPIVHYVKDPSNQIKDNPIYTVVDKPLDLSKMEEKPAMEYLRNRMATWNYLLMEKYGNSTREEELKGRKFHEVWEEHLKNRIKTVGEYYDSSIESISDYQFRWKRERTEIFNTLSEIRHITKDNAHTVAHAIKEKRHLLKDEFQNRF